MTNDPYLTPTNDETETLRMHIRDWDELDARPQSVCVAIFRGHQRVEDITEVLGVTCKQVEFATSQVIGRGLVYDSSLKQFILK